jgi:hypothetical protein
MAAPTILSAWGYQDLSILEREIQGITNKKILNNKRL